MAINQNSMDAFNHIKKNGLLSDKRLKVYQIFMHYPDGLTGSEVSDIYKKHFLHLGSYISLPPINV